MKRQIKDPALSGEKLIALVFLASLVSSLPLLRLSSYKTEASSLQDSQKQEAISFLEENTIMPAYNPANPVKVTRTFNVVITAYSSTVEETDDTPFITASGSWVRDGIIANNMLPFGTKIRIPELYGDKVFVVEDRMNWRKSNYHVDIWFPSKSEAKEFGAERTYIEVLEG
jgi:3D (Asp-Asp-Asp) domain-containing protein